MRVARVPRGGRTSRTRGGPAVPGVAGGLPAGRSTGTTCRSCAPCQEVLRPSGSHPSRLPPWRIYAAAVGAGPATSPGGPPVVRIQPERRSRAVSRGWLSIPPGEGVDSAVTDWRPAPCGADLPYLMDGSRDRGTADTVVLEPSGCRQSCPGRLSSARGPASPSCTRRERIQSP